jgi:hypothetical protein
METNSEISGNINSSSGGGVYVASGGRFEMSGGEIHHNTSSGGGGGVFVEDSTFEMSGGTISDNTGTSGGGVLVYNGEFEMSGGEIYHNTSTSSGGGVYLVDGTFTMSNGTISDNTSTRGGGVYLVDGTFTMNSGTISHNTGSTYGGGGVFVNGGTFTKTDGTIYGSNATDALKNTAGNGIGHAVYVNSGSKKRNNTAGTDVALDSAVTGGTWEATLGFSITMNSVPVDPSLSGDLSLFDNETMTFSVDNTSNVYSSIKWYLDGTEIAGATSSSYTLNGSSTPAGVHELSVHVTTASTNEKLSAHSLISVYKL